VDGEDCSGEFRTLVSLARVGFVIWLGTSVR
jgi:hypothetical protein